MPTLDARGFDDFPGVDEAEFFEVLKTHLAGAKAGKQEFLDLEGVQVAVVVEALQDHEVALGECSMKSRELWLRWTSVGGRRNVSKDDWMS